MKIKKRLKRYCINCGIATKHILYTNWEVEFFKCLNCNREEKIIRIKHTRPFYKAMPTKIIRKITSKDFTTGGLR